MKQTGTRKHARRTELNPYEQALEKPTWRALAIRAKCWDCEGQGVDPGWQDRVRNCVVDRCPLWHVRPYQPERCGQRFRDPDSAREGVGTGSEEIGLPDARGELPASKKRLLARDPDPFSGQSAGRAR
jgi:hypothetical protein